MSVVVLVTTVPNEQEMSEIVAVLNEAQVEVRKLDNWGSYSLSIGGSVVIEFVDSEARYADVMIQYHYDQFKVICARVDFVDATFSVASTNLNSHQVGAWFEIQNVKMYDVDGTVLEPENLEDEASDDDDFENDFEDCEEED